MIKNINLIIACFLLFAVLTVCLFSENRNILIPANTHAVFAPQVILDAGHGGLTNTIKV